MGKTSDEVLTELLSTSLKVDKEKIASYREGDAWKDDAVPALLALDSARVTALQQDFEQKLTAIRGTVKRETLDELEAKVREKFGLGNDVKARGVDLVDHVVTTKVGAASSRKDDDVKTHPAYVSLEQQIAAFPKMLEDKLNEQRTTLQGEFKTKGQMAQVVSKGMTIFEGMRPILPKNAEVAAAQKTLLVNFLMGGDRKYRFEENDRGEVTNIIPLDKEGTGALKDDHGHPIAFNDLVKQGAARFFEFAEGEPKGAAPSPNGTGAESGGSGGGQGGGANPYDPKTTSDYARMHGEIRNKYADHAERQKQWALLKEAGVKAGVASK